MASWVALGYGAYKLHRAYNATAASAARAAEAVAEGIETAAVALGETAQAAVTMTEETAQAAGTAVLDVVETTTNVVVNTGVAEEEVVLQQMIERSQNDQVNSITSEEIDNQAEKLKEAYRKKNKRMEYVFPVAQTALFAGIL